MVRLLEKWEPLKEFFSSEMDSVILKPLKFEKKKGLENTLCHLMISLSSPKDQKLMRALYGEVEECRK